jgi:hypothetical protein
VRAIRESDERATRLASRYGVSETLIRAHRPKRDLGHATPAEGTRLPALGTLLLAGPRMSDLSQFNESQVDLAARRIRMPRVKTDASERAVPMVPTLHEPCSAPGPSVTHTGGAPSRSIRTHPVAPARVCAGARERTGDQGALDRAGPRRHVTERRRLHQYSSWRRIQPWGESPSSRPLGTRSRIG